MIANRLKDKRFGIVVLFLFLFIIFLGSFEIIKQGEVGVVTRFGRATGREMSAGFNWKLPIMESVTKMDVKIKRVDGRSSAGTKDLQTVDSSVVLNYHINPEDASDIFGRIGDDDMLYEKVIFPAIQEVVKGVFSQYRAEELLTKREEVKASIDDKLSERLVTYWVRVDDISLTDITFSKEFDKAIEAKQIAEQLTQKAQYEVQTAKAEAEKNAVQTAALTPEILKKMWIEKWDGKLPSVVSDKANIMYGIE